MSNGLTTHLPFDVFGTLVAYSSSRTGQGCERSFQALQKAGSSLGYEGFLSLWSDVAAEFDESALVPFVTIEKREGHQPRKSDKCRSNLVDGVL